jgi:hypothetical protein
MEEQIAEITEGNKKPLVIRNDLTLSQPSDDVTRTVLVYRTTLARWIEIVVACKGQHFDAVAFVMNVCIGVFLTALGPAMIDVHAQKHPDLTPWIGVAMLFFVASLVTGAVYLRMGSFEAGSLISLTGELKEHKDRYDDQLAAKHKI